MLFCRKITIFAPQIRLSYVELPFSDMKINMTITHINENIGVLDPAECAFAVLRG